jgi:hypothetical protein
MQGAMQSSDPARFRAMWLEVWSPRESFESQTTEGSSPSEDERIGLGSNPNMPPGLPPGSWLVPRPFVAFAESWNHGFRYILEAPCVFVLYAHRWRTRSCEWQRDGILEIFQRFAMVRTHRSPLSPPPQTLGDQMVRSLGSLYPPVLGKGDPQN